MILESLKYSETADNELNNYFEAETNLSIESFMTELAKCLSKWMSEDERHGIESSEFTDSNNPTDYFVFAMELIKRSKIPITKTNIHCLFTIGVLLVMKILEDNSPDNNTFSKVCGVRLNKLNRLEHIFVHRLNWDLSFPPNFKELCKLDTNVSKKRRKISQNPKI